MKDDVTILSELANVSRSGYYKWLRRAAKPDKDYNDYLEVKEVFDKGKGRWGWRYRDREGARNGPVDVRERKLH